MKNKFFILFFYLLSTTFLFSQNCTGEDCVWPGDANQNGIANNIDVLFTAQIYYETGAPRENLNTDWTPKEVQDWAGSFESIGVNYKHADFNGDGEILSGDMYDIAENYNQTNEFFEGTWGTEIPGTDLYVTWTDENPQVGDTITLIVNLGSEENPITDVSGVAFSIEIDTALIQEEVIFPTDYSQSWFGIEVADFIAFEKFDVVTNPTQRDYALSRYNGETISGFGEILRFDILIEDVFDGLIVQNEDQATEQALERTNIEAYILRLFNVYGTTNNAEEKIITVKKDSILINDVLDRVKPILANSSEILIFPNPTHSQIHIDTHTIPLERIEIYDSYGVLRSQKIINSSSFNMDLSNLSPGIYYSHFICSDRTFMRRVVKL